MTLPTRVLGLVVAPPETRDRAFSPPAPATAAARVTALAAATDASAAAAAVTLALLRRDGRSCGMAVSWGGRGEDPPPAGALPVAARLAGRLRGEGFDAAAAGHLVRVGLAGDSIAACDGWRALCREEVPAVLSVAGPRSDALDAELARTDAILVVTARSAPDGLVSAAYADACRIGPPVAVADMRMG
jgi:hypothetical protein